MNILAHRGQWTDHSEANSLEAMRTAFSSDFGVETDVRDQNGELVIAHDIADHESPAFDDFVTLRRQIAPYAMVALNVKADGISGLLRAKLSDTDLRQMFFFDMSSPEMLRYAQAKLPFFTRQSDIEKVPVLYDEAVGVWLDAFHSEWYQESTIADHLAQHKRVCIVSPELHGRDCSEPWNNILSWNLHRHPDISLCTDYPIEAERYFNE